MRVTFFSYFFSNAAYLLNQSQRQDSQGHQHDNPQEPPETIIYDSNPFELQKFIYQHPSIIITAIRLAHNNIENNLSTHATEENMKLDHIILDMFSSSTTLENLGNQLPKSLLSIKNRLGVKASMFKKICCPTCFSLYKYPKQAKDGIRNRQSLRSLPDQHCKTILMGSYGVQMPCQTSLWAQEKNKKTYYPAKLFFHQSLKEWIATRLLWPDFEHLLESHFQHTSPSSNSSFSDIWDGKMWKEFKDKDQRVFTDTKGHLVFGLYLDWVNPYGLKPSGKSISIGVIFLICFNLPPEIRYKPHNMFIYGFTPTPIESKSAQLNNLLQPLVMELQELWNGVKFTKTHSNTNGRIIKAVLLPLIGDTPALRKVAGFASHSANIFCAHCNLPKTDLQNFNKDDWPEKNEEEHVAKALEWSIAKSINHQKQILKTFGARYTSLQDLPNWMPKQMMTIDVMHTFILGILKDFSTTYLKIQDVGMIIHEKNKQQGPIPLSQSASVSSSILPSRKRRTAESISSGGESYKRKKSDKGVDLQNLTVLSPIEKVQDWTIRQSPLASHFDLQLAASSSAVKVVVPRIEDLKAPPPSKASSSDSASDGRGQQRRSSRAPSHSSNPSLREKVLRSTTAKGKRRAISPRLPQSLELISEHSPKSYLTGDNIPSSQSSSVSQSRKGASHQSSRAGTIDFDIGKHLYMTVTELELLQKGCSDIIVPSWVTRLPKTVGMPSAGSPKAAEWLILYTVHFVLVLIPYWSWSQDPDPLHAEKLLKVTSNLIGIINIVMSHTITNIQLEYLDQALVDYRVDLLENWGYHIQSKPLLHCAQHMTEVIKLYGPPSVFSTWAGERLNHVLTFIKKNQNPSKFICFVPIACHVLIIQLLLLTNSKGHLDQSLFSGLIEKTNLQGLVSNLNNNWKSSQFPVSNLPNLYEILYERQNGISKAARQIEETTYEQLKLYLEQAACDNEGPHFSQCTWINCKSMTHEGKRITPKNYHIGNSQISFDSGQHSNIPEMGQVKAILWEANQKKYYFHIEVFDDLFVADHNKNPYINMKEIPAKLVYQTRSKSRIIEPSMIKGHIASISYPATASGTLKDTLCVVALHYNTSL